MRCGPPRCAGDGVKISRQPASACGSDETLEEVKEVVADYGMDPGKLVMKWKNVDRIVDRIVELSLARAQKGRRLCRAPDRNAH